MPIHRIYLAGPEVFHPAAITLGAEKKRLCALHGFEGVFPLDAVLNVAGLAGPDAGRKIGTANESLIGTCDAVIANITPFRGPSADVGTAYEMGFAAGLGLIVCAYSNDPALFTQRTNEFLHGRVRTDDAGRRRDRDDMSIEEFGLVDNLMLDTCVANSGGCLMIADKPVRSTFTHLEVFERCLRELAAHAARAKH